MQHFTGSWLLPHDKPGPEKVPAVAGAGAEGVVVTNPVGQDLVYAGPADARPPIVSVDGQTFGPLASLTRTTAAGVSAPVAAADVTTLRWLVAQPVPAGGEVRLSFRARLK